MLRHNLIKNSYYQSSNWIELGCVFNIHISLEGEWDECSLSIFDIIESENINEGFLTIIFRIMGVNWYEWICLSRGGFAFRI